MKKRNQDLIYIYDTEHHKMIMIDSETGERVHKEDDEVTSFLKYLDEQGQNQLLRKFAVWCAHEINDSLKPIQKKILDLAEEAIYTDVDIKSLEELYRETEGTAIATDTVGLRQGSRSAPAYLAARECINPNALDGAIQAARFHRLWMEMDEQEEFSDQALQKIHASSDHEPIKKITRQQTDKLLDLMNE